MKTKVPVPNPAYDATTAILRGADYRCISEFTRQKERGYLMPEDHFEVWAGAKGTIIAQVWKDGNGVALYANWPLGYTHDDLKAALS